MGFTICMYKVLNLTQDIKFKFTVGIGDHYKLATLDSLETLGYSYGPQFINQFIRKM